MARRSPSGRCIRGGRNDRCIAAAFGGSAGLRAACADVCGILPRLRGHFPVLRPAHGGARRSQAAPVQLRWRCPSPCALVKIRTKRSLSAQRRIHDADDLAQPPDRAIRRCTGVLPAFRCSWSGWLGTVRSRLGAERQASCWRSCSRPACGLGLPAHRAQSCWPPDGARKFEAQLPDAIDILVRSLRVGSSGGGGDQLGGARAAGSDAERISHRRRRDDLRPRPRDAP